jgi:hypothetical protein
LAPARVTVKRPSVLTLWAKAKSRSSFFAGGERSSVANISEAGSIGRGGNRLPAPRPLYQRIRLARSQSRNRFQSHQGYSLCGWSKAGLNYLIISELSPADIKKFEDQLREWIE